jgi:hypothetical protein
LNYAVGGLVILRTRGVRLDDGILQPISAILSIESLGGDSTFTVKLPGAQHMDLLRMRSGLHLLSAVTATDVARQPNAFDRLAVGGTADDACDRFSRAIAGQFRTR